MKTILILVTAFLISWIPYSVYAVTSVIGYTEDIHPLIGTLPSLFAKSSILWNPLIYVCRNRSFKRALLETFPTFSLIYRCTDRCRRRRSSGEIANELTKMVDLQVPVSHSSQKSDTNCDNNSGSCVRETGIDRNERVTEIF